MSDTYTASIGIGISSAPAVQGAQVVKRSLMEISDTAKRTVSSVDSVNASIKELMARNSQENAAIVSALDSLKKKSEETKPKVDDLRKALDDLKKSASDNGGAGTLDFMKAFNELGNSAMNGKIGLSGFGSAIKDIGSTAVATTSVIAALAAELAIIYKLGYDAAQLKEQVQNFKALSNSLGADADRMISSMRSASEGTVDNASMMKAATETMAKGVRVSADEMGRLYEIAYVKGKLFGRETNDVLNTITSSAASGMTRGLKQLGITFDETFEKGIMKMSDYEKKQTIVNEVIKQGGLEAERLRGKLGDAGDGFEQMGVASTHLSQAIKGFFGDMGPVIGILAWITNKVADYLVQVNAVKNAWAQWIGSVLHYSDELGLTKSGGPLDTSGFHTLRKMQYMSNSPEELEKMIAKASSQYDRVRDYKISSSNEGGRSFTVPMGGGTYFVKGVASESELYRQDKLKGLAQELQLLREVKLEKEEGAAKAKELAKNELDAALAAFAAAQGTNDADEDRRKSLEGIKAAKEEEFRIDNRLAEVRQELDRRPMSQVFDGMTTAMNAAVSASSGLNVNMAGLGVYMKNVSDQATAMTALPQILAAAKAGMVNFLGVDWTNKISEYQKEQEGAGYLPGLLSSSQNFLSTFYGAVTKTPSKQTQLRDLQASWAESENDIISKIDSLHGKLQISVSDAFEQGLYDSMSGGNFLESFGNALREQVIRALSAGITAQIFGVGGMSGNLGSVLFGSSGIGGMLGGTQSQGTGGLGDIIKTGISYLTGGSGGSSSTGASAGLLGGLFKNVWNKGGGFNVGNMLSNVGVGMAVSYVGNKLFGEGGVFGSSHVHGQEWIQASADLNTQVSQAKTLRDEIYKGIGMSEATRQALADAEFNYTWTSKHKSGNGITSKKTTTYQLEGAGAAQASIDTIKKLQETAEGEMAYREFDIAKAAQFGGVRSLQMALDDVNNVVKRIYEFKEGSTTEYKFTKAEQANLLTQQLQTRSQLNDAIGQARNTAASYLFGNAYSAAEAGAEPSWATGTYQYKSGGGLFRRSRTMTGTYQYINDTGAAAIADVARGQLGLPDDIGMIKYLLPTMKSSAEKEFAYNKSVIEAGDDPAKIAEVLGTRKGMLKDALETYESIWKEAESAAKDQTKSVEEQKAAFDRFQEAQTAVYNTRLEILQTEKSIADAEKASQEEKKAKMEQKTQDILGTLLTRVGEVSTDKSGQQVIVLSSGQPAGRKLVDELIAAQSGSNPELVKVLKELIQAVGTRWN